MKCVCCSLLIVVVVVVVAVVVVFDAVCSFASLKSLTLFRALDI